MRLPGKIDLHMHSTASDGTDSPAVLLEGVRRAGLIAFSVTDHDSFAAGPVIRSMLRACDPPFIQGIEFSCKDEYGKYHILGYGFDDLNVRMRTMVEQGHERRMEKLQARLDFLASEFGFVFSEEEIKGLFALNNPGKPHIGNLMVSRGYASSKEQAITDYINKVKISADYFRPEEAIETILAASGVPVLAHPYFGSGDENLTDVELEERVERLLSFGLQGMEACYFGFPPKLLHGALALAEKHRLYVTAGSDYHGKNRLVGIGETALDELEECPEGLVRFLERFDAI
ncbi:MAG: PHP domain-containing protein [Clostridia bacterium]|nr:PHP domain-containing protein [Clostridia bacterium]